MDGVEEFEVKKVLDSRRRGRGRKLQYLIKWTGYPDSDNQWVSWEDVKSAEDTIWEFAREYPDRKTHIKASKICLLSTTHSSSHNNYMPCRCDDDYSVSTGLGPTDTPSTTEHDINDDGTVSPTYSSLGYDHNNNVDDIHGSDVITPEYQATLDAQRTQQQ